MEGTMGHIAIGEADRVHLKRSAKWAMFIAIVQFIFLGFGLIILILALLGATLAGASMAEMSGLPYALPDGAVKVYMITLIIMLVVSFFITLYLYRFAAKTLQAIELGNDAAMTEAFNNLGKYFRLTGILLIISLALLVLVMVLVIVFAGAIAGGMR